MVTLKQLSNGFEYLEVQNEAAQAKIALQGAHLFHYARHNETPLLWVSDASAFTPAQAIRGGIPLCWPWFGAHASNTDMPQHGFARTLMWTFIDSSEHTNATKLVLLLKSSDETFSFWPYHFELTYNITIGETLSLELITKNCDDKAFTITQALHTYFNITDISNIHVNGLEEKPYFDAVTKRFGTEKGSICIHEEFDRVYQEVTKPVTLVDKHRSVTITNEGSASAIVWNPWIEKCARMSAMEPESYKTMLCIESANALDDARTIAPNESHTLKTVITIG